MVVAADVDIEIRRNWREMRGRLCTHDNGQKSHDTAQNFSSGSHFCSEQHVKPELDQARPSGAETHVEPRCFHIIAPDALPLLLLYERCWSCFHC